jgi:hypothetical protein
VRLLEPIVPSIELAAAAGSLAKEAGAELSPEGRRDALSSLLRRRLLQASLSPDISALRLPAPAPASLAPGALTRAERAKSVLALALTLLLALLFFLALHAALRGGLGLTNGQIAAWGSGLSLGVTAAIFAHYSLKLRRASPGAPSSAKKKTK